MTSISLRRQSVKPTTARRACSGAQAGVRRQMLGDELPARNDIVAEEEHQRLPDLPHAVVAGLPLAAVRLPHDRERRMQRGHRPHLEPLPGAVGRAVVDDDDAEVAPRLIAQRVEGALEYRPPVVGRNDDRKRKHRGRHDCPRRYRRRGNGLPVRGTLLGSMR